MSKLEDSIDALFETEPIPSETAQKLLDLFLRNAETAEKKMYTRFTSVIVLWLFAFGVDHGMLTEASFLGVKIKDMSILLLGLPFLGGAIYYGIITSFCAAFDARSALRQLIKHHWKKVYENDVDFLVVPQSFLSVEAMTLRHAQGWVQKLHNMWILLMVATYLFVPLACIVHMSYLAFEKAPVPWWLSTGLIVLTGLFIIRAIALLVQSERYSGN